MNGSHPIDDLFRSRLGGLEPEPPPAVWRAVAAQTAHGSRRIAVRLSLALLLLLLMGGGGWWLMRPKGDSRATAEMANVPAAAPNSQASIVPAEEQVPASASVQLDREDPVPASAGRSMTPEDVRTNQPTASDHATAPVVVTGCKADARTDARSAPAKPGVPNEVIDAGLAAGERSMDGPIAHLAWRQAKVEVPTAVPQSAPAIPVQLLQRGGWWVALQGGIGQLAGEWKGPGAEALNSAEEWQRTTDLGIRFGRRWTNGFSVGSGLGLVAQRSRFLYNATAAPVLEETLDTSWAGTPMGVLTVYTWSIDTVTFEAPGPSSSWSATNRYTLLRMPLELGWRQDARRLQYGVRCGVQMDLYLQREGQTLETAGEPGSAFVAPLSEARFNNRFTHSFAATAALEFGYLLGDRWALLAGPQVAWPLGSSVSAAPRPVLGSVGAWGRLEYLFGKRSLASQRP